MYPFLAAYSWRTGGCHLKQTLKKWSVLILFLFLFPILLNLLPNSGTTAQSKMIKEPLKIVYASNVFEEEVSQNTDSKALLYFTHNHEAFEPITKEKNGKISVSHKTENITKFGEKLGAQLSVNGIETDLLPVDNMVELNKKALKYERAYHSIRGYVEKQIQEVDYDLIIDIHRDAVGRDKTVVTHADENYARVAFVIGKEHANFKHNEEKARRMKEEMEKLVPGITRGIIMKSGPRVDGKYNQDLHPSLILMELGGIENTEEELNRTIAVIADATTAVLSNKN